MRGIWLATVIGLDWPPAASLKAETAQERVRLQKQGLTDALDEMVKTGLTRCIFRLNRTARLCGAQISCPGQKS